MKVPVAVVEVLISTKSPDDQAGGMAIGESILKAVAEQERNWAGTSIGQAAPKQWTVVSDEGRCVAPQVYSWAFSEVEELRHLPDHKTLTSLSDTSRVILRLPVVIDTNHRGRRNIVVGTRAAIIAAQLLDEARLTGVVNEIDSLGFDFEGWLGDLGELLDKSKTIALTRRQAREEYFRAKGDLASSTRGKSVIGKLSRYGVTAKSDWLRSYLNLPKLFM